MKYLDRGSNNCTLLDNGVVIRIAVLKTNHKLPLLLRGEGIIKLLIKDNQTPSVVKIIESGKVVDTLPIDYDDMCGIMGDYPYFIQKIEYLPFQFDTITDESIFFIIWFLSLTSTKYGFVHKDIKEDNILMREYNSEKTFDFELDDTVYRLSTKYVPVVIDFDFGSVYITNTQYSIGTVSYAPPEIVLSVLCGVHISFNDYSYDWWSFGMTIYHLLFKNQEKYGFDPDLIDKYVNYNVEKFSFLEEKTVKQMVLSIIQTTVIKKVISDTDRATGYDELFKDFYDAKNNEILEDILKSVEFRIYRTALLLAIPDKYLNIMRMLLSWEPKKRHLGGSPWTYLNIFFSQFIYHGADDADFSYSAERGKEYSPNRLKGLESKINY